MLRFFLGLGFGVVLTVYSFAFVGVGHGTYAPMGFTASFVALMTNWGALPVLLMAPFLWAFYFLFIPRLRARGMRITATVAILSCHVLAGIWFAIEDPAFTRALSDQIGGLIIFILLLTTIISCLVYFAVRGAKQVRS